MVHVQGVEQLRSSAYLGMVTKLAWRTWQQLPLHTKTWISIDDMVLDGLRWVEMAGFDGRWNKRRGGLTTILYMGVLNYYKDHYIRRFIVAKKANEQKVVSIQEQEQRYREKGMEFEFERAFRMPVKQQNEIEQQFLNCMAADKLVGIYQVASDEMKENIRDWFFRYAIWQEKDEHGNEKRIQWYTKTDKFREAAKEFRALAIPRGITIKEARHLMTNPLCLEKMSRELTGLPYAWDAPVR